MQLSSAQLALLGAIAVGAQWLLTQDAYREALAMPFFVDAIKNFQAALGPCIMRHYTNDRSSIHCKTIWR